MRIRTRTRWATATAALAVSGLALTACGGGGGEAGSTSRPDSHSSSTPNSHEDRIGSSSNLTVMGKTTPAIARGSTNELGVRCVQIAVNVWASHSGQGEPLAVDSEFGDATYTWVKRFQKAKHLVQDGVVGPRTGDEIYGVLSSNPGTARSCYPAIPVTRDM